MTKRNGKSPPLRGNKEAQQALILKVIAKAGPEGILRVQIAEKTKLGVKVVARGLEALAGKVYVAAWPHSGSCRFPAYAIGPGPDVPRQHVGVLRQHLMCLQGQESCFQADLSQTRHLRSAWAQT